jgi:hypothetical protein
MVRARARLHRDQRRRTVGEKGRQLRAPERCLQNDLLGRIDAAHGK